MVFGKEEQQLKRTNSRIRIRKSRNIKRFLKDLTDEYQDAYLNLITSNMEGFSLALLECESHGVPSISYDIQYGPGELIQDGKNGYLIERIINTCYLKSKIIAQQPPTSTVFFSPLYRNCTKVFSNTNHVTVEKFTSTF